MLLHQNLTLLKLHQVM